MKSFPVIRTAALTAVILANATATLRAQELEPRAYSNAPIGLNFAIFGYGHTSGDVLQDASSPLQDAEVSADGLVLAYARTLNVWGDCGKFDVVLPFAWASGSASYLGQRQQRDVSGFGNPSVRFTWNFIGAPAMTLEEFQKHRSDDWIVGASFRVGLPLGQYEPDKLLNIGTNRWSFKPELGVSKTWGRWTFELDAAAAFYTDNDDFFGSLKREQDPIFALQAHAIYNFRNGVWAGLDGTWYQGGRTTLNGQANDDEQSNTRLGLTLALPFSPRQSLKLYASTGTTARAAGDFTTVGVAWQYRWGGGLPAARLSK